MKLGILGGTFDPIHHGHLAAAAAAEAALGLDRIVLVPSRVPPHRSLPDGSTAEQRLAMVTLAVAGRPGWSVSRLELDRDGPSYTFDTLAALGRGGDELFFILGADAFADIATWSRYPAVLDLSHFVVVSRPGITLDSLRERVPSAFNRDASAGTRVMIVESSTPDISSTEIRHRARTGASLRGLVPDAVADYISTHHLYARA